MAPSRLAPPPHREGERIVKRLTKQEKIAVLKRAKALLRRPNGWVRGRLRQAHLTDAHLGGPVTAYSYCVLGACQQAAIEKGVVSVADAEWWWNTDTVYPLARRLGLTRPAAAVRLNDAPQTKKADVIRLLDEYIKALEEYAA